MLLTTTSDVIQLVTGAAVNVDVAAEYADLTSGVVSAGRLLTKITTATTTTIVASPAASTARKVKELQIQNVHASSSVVITIQQYDGTNTVNLESITLLAGERIGYREATGYTLIGANGIDKSNTAPLPSGASTVAQIASHSADTYYLGFPVTGRLQAGSQFTWSIKGLSKTAGTAAPVFTVRCGTAGTTADTARAAITLGAQTAVPDQGAFELTAVFRAVGAAAIIRADVDLQHNLLITGFAATPAGQAFGGNTGASFDSTVANSIIGLSVNPGAAGAWVVESCVLDAVNLLP